MAISKQGFEVYLAYGTAGSQAGNQLLHATDVDYDVATEKGSSKYRGDGSAPPINYERVTGRNATVNWKMIRKVGDTHLAALVAAARAGTPVAIYYKDYSGGTGYDGDMVLSVKHLGPINGEQTFEFSGTPNDDLRVANLNAS